MYIKIDFYRSPRNTFVRVPFSTFGAPFVRYAVALCTTFARIYWHVLAQSPHRSYWLNFEEDCVCVWKVNSFLHRTEGTWIIWWNSEWDSCVSLFDNFEPWTSDCERLWLTKIEREFSSCRKPRGNRMRHYGIWHIVWWKPFRWWRLFAESIYSQNTHTYSAITSSWRNRYSCVCSHRHRQHTPALKVATTQHPVTTENCIFSGSVSDSQRQNTPDVNASAAWCLLLLVCVCALYIHIIFSLFFSIFVSPANSDHVQK